MTAPTLSVIVPAHAAERLLPDTLGALRASRLPRPEWELIVVDDASADGTAAVAEEFADRVIRLVGKPSGPGGARNAGAAEASGEWLVFIDADVRVHSDTLDRFLEATRRHPDAVAIFGAYDDRPEARGIVSEFRNLLHRYVHMRGAGEASTFWAGCGAVRRDAYEAVGGFDTDRFPRPQIEDIELGYRLRDRGGSIILDPDISGTHLKRWTFGAMVRTDVRDRGIPWMRLLLERRGRTAVSLNAGGFEQAKVAVMGMALAALFLAVVLAGTRLLVVSVVAMGMVTLANWPAHRWFATVRSPGFALATAPLLLVYYASSAVAAAAGVVAHLWATVGERAAPA
jgi:glycosyltransferase involved in cell wall biosynthesis